jgi:hypothetical protein
VKITLIQKIESAVFVVGVVLKQTGTLKATKTIALITLIVMSGISLKRNVITAERV